MTARSRIVDAIIEKFKDISIKNGYNTDIYKNVYKGVKFWDSINDFPSVYVAAGAEIREYLPGEFKWAFLNITARIFVKESDPQARLEKILEDIESVLDANNSLVYDTNKETVEISIISITTDEGILTPYGAAEMVFQIRYDL